MIGIVQNIIYKNDDDFMICEIESNDIPKEYRNHFDPTTCVILGNMVLIEELQYEFNGKWIFKEDYGWELKVENYKEILPDGKNKRALISYLQSGLFDGIGPIIAKRIVDYFGENTLNIIQNEPEKLANVKGISKNKANIIFDCYLKNQQYQELMLLLKPYGISTKKIIKIADKYRFQTLNILKTNPYIICKEFDGFGFLTADAFAMASGLDRKNNFRIKEAIKYCIEKSAQEKGNLYVTKTMLGNSLSKVLNNDLKNYVYNKLKSLNGKNPTREEFQKELQNNFVNEEDVLIALEELNDEKLVKIEYKENTFKKNTFVYNTKNEQIATVKKDDTFLIDKYINKNCIKINYQGIEGYINPTNCQAIQFDCYSSLYYNCEMSAAKHINRLLYSKEIKSIQGSVVEALTKMEEKYNIEYAPKQKEAIVSMLKKNLLVITGGPGTGKTTVIKGIIGTYKHFFPNDEIVLAAPTGRAAKRMTETTNEEAMTIHRLLEFVPNLGFQRNEENPIEADVIIIDESSMVDILLFVALLKAIPTSCKLILVGDVDQLPSVGPGTVLKDVIQSKKVTTVYLNEIFRQADTSKIVINAYKINHKEKTLEYSTDFSFHRMEKYEYEDLSLAVVKSICEIYQKELTKYDFDVNKVQVLVPFRTKRQISVDELNKILEPIANPRPDNEIKLQYGNNLFRINDKVMQLKNNYEKNVFNGDIGFIREIYKDENGYKISVDYGLDELVVYDDFDEISLAYVSTIHKSQGSEYSSVIIPILTDQEFFLQRCILYTAITRAKENCKLIGEYAALMTAIGRNNINERKTKLTTRIDEYDITKIPIVA